MLTAIRAKRILTMAHSGPSASVDKNYFSFPDTTPDHRGASPASTIPAVIYDGVVVSEDDTIIAVCSYDTFCHTYLNTQSTKGQHAEELLTDLGDVTILPAVINCHNHLELSQLYGKTVSDQGFEAWIESLLPLLAAPLDAQDISLAAAEMAQHGTAHVGDISSRMPADVYQAVQQQGMSCTLFMECFGYDFPTRFTTADIWPASTVTLTTEVQQQHAALAGHALYSTHPTALIFAKQWCRTHNKPFSIHLAEHAGEIELLTQGTGRFANQLSHRVLPKDYTAPGIRPVPYALELGLLDDQTLAVHCVQCDETDVGLLAQSGASVCLCPRSNAYIGVGHAPVSTFMAAAIPLCLGTDSLASNTDMNLWNEARALRRNNAVPTGALLRMLTVGGAHALGVHNELGTLEPGKRFRYSVLPGDFMENAPEDTTTPPMVGTMGEC